MEKYFKGKTKIVYPESKDKLRLEFRDTVLGQDGRPDSGGNQVVGYEKGKGRYAMQLCGYFFNLLDSPGVNTHYIDSLPESKSILVERADVFGQGLEFICRRKAAGSFLRRYGDYIKEFQNLNYLVEITIKDDKKGDPVINDDTLEELGIISPEDLKRAKKITEKVAGIINGDLKKKGLELIDIKVEFGKKKKKLMVIDTMNCDNMRVWDAESEVFLGHKKLYKILMGESRT
ncbi:MAG: phosphoribosylaminoimidazolesuccinocarboxamide synthase [Elusimicrobia bacterium]|jgi:phosphoribosylaminoimidazole-succinocarboxamide synthase|nr:phosphoribosylaminoimidazolesuccinocarboxamide synthase [Elusimicrobiota bacterium]